MTILNNLNNNVNDVLILLANVINNNSGASNAFLCRLVGKKRAYGRTIFGFKSRIECFERTYFTQTVFLQTA